MAVLNARRSIACGGHDRPRIALNPQPQPYDQINDVNAVAMTGAPNKMKLPTTTPSPLRKGILPVSIISPTPATASPQSVTAKVPNSV
jgi:hypothetical protein